MLARPAKQCAALLVRMLRWLLDCLEKHSVRPAAASDQCPVTSKQHSVHPAAASDQYPVTSDLYSVSSGQEDVEPSTSYRSPLTDPTRHREQGIGHSSPSTSHRSPLTEAGSSPYRVPEGWGNDSSVPRPEPGIMSRIRKAWQVDSELSVQIRNASQTEVLPSPKSEPSPATPPPPKPRVSRPTIRFAGEPKPRIERLPSGAERLVLPETKPDPTTYRSQVTGHSAFPLNTEHSRPSAALKTSLPPPGHDRRPREPGQPSEQPCPTRPELPPIPSMNTEDSRPVAALNTPHPGHRSQVTDHSSSLLLNTECSRPSAALNTSPWRPADEDHWEQALEGKPWNE